MLLLAIICFLYQRAKRRCTPENLESDEVFAAIDRDLGTGLTLCSLIFICAFLFFGIYVSGMPQAFATDSMSFPVFVLVMATFIAGTFISLYLQTRIITLTTVSYTHLDVYKRQLLEGFLGPVGNAGAVLDGRDGVFQKLGGVFGGLGALDGQIAHLIGDDGEALAGRACSGGLNGGV